MLGCDPQSRSAWATPPLRDPLSDCPLPLLRYYVALKEVMAVRKAEARGAVVPEWVPFSACNECQLCKADFFWASTLRSEVRCSLPDGDIPCQGLTAVRAETLRASVLHGSRTSRLKIVWLAEIPM